MLRSAAAWVIGLAACSAPPTAAAIPAADQADPGKDVAEVSDLSFAETADAVPADLSAPADIVDVAAPSDLGPDAKTGDVDADLADEFGDVAADGLADVDAQPTVAVEVDPGEPGGLVSGACVNAENLSPSACFTVKCAPGKVCMGKGECVPAAAFWADDSAPATQAWAAVATREGGGYGVAWAAGNFFEGEQHIWLRVFAQGTEVGGTSLQVSASGTKANLAPSVAALGDGSWIVLWRRDDMQAGVVSYWAQRVLADGSALDGAPLQVNLTTLGSSESSGSTNIIAPVIVRLRNGRMLMAWSGGIQGGATPMGIYARLFDTQGQPMSAELDTGGIDANGPSFSPGIAALPGGKALLVWQGAAGGAKGPQVVRGRVLGDDGTPQTPVLLLTPSAQSYEALPAAAGYLSGQALVSWKAGDDPNATSAVNVRARLLGTPLPAAAGLPLPAGAAMLLDSDSEGTYPGASPLAVLSQHRAMAIWHNQGDPLHTIWGKRHYRSVDAWECEASNLGGPLLSGEAGPRWLPALASWENGKVVLAFSTNLVGMDQFRVAVRLWQW